MSNTARNNRRKKALGLAAAILALSSFCLAVQPGEADQENMAFVAGRLRFAIGKNALPAQIQIVPAREDLPLELRGEDADEPSPELLRRIGRGPQLAAPMRLVATVGGNDVALSPEQEISIKRTKGKVTCESSLAGEEIMAELQVAYAPDGAMQVSITYSGREVNDLALVMDLSGPVDTVVSGGAPFDSPDVALREGEGLLWGNAKPSEKKKDEKPAPESRGRPGVPGHMFWGSGDRGFTWLCNDADGWTVTPENPTITLRRDETGMVTWRAILVNHTSRLKGKKTIAFTLLTHPAIEPDTDQRAVEWLKWPDGGKGILTPPLTAAARKAKVGPVRADRAGVYETLTVGSVLIGPAGGNARSVGQTLADSFPLPLFRYLAGTHTGLPGRLKSNTRELGRAGMNPACDRMAIGRALLHDVGCDPEGVVHLAMMARLMQGLAKFRYFVRDGKTEYIPYWRSENAVRYGERFSKDDAFTLTREDPMARVHTSVWVRAAPDGKEGRQALILVVNEGKKAVRQQLYILDPQRLFGGHNQFRKSDMVDRWDGNGIPEDSDWALAKLRREGTHSVEMGTKRRGNVPFLLDVEDLGGVDQSVANEDTEVYHRLHVPARSFRLLYGRGEQ
ncbi:MAG: hypothetical protein ACLFWL_12735 [Candidatus Brocadiia bacterium]